MATYSEIQTRVQTRLIDLPPALLTEIPLLVKSAHREIQKRHSFLVMKDLFDLTTTIGEREYDGPSQFKEWQNWNKPYGIDNVGGSWPLTFASGSSAASSLMDQNQEGKPRLITWNYVSDGQFSDTTLEVWPLPDGASDFGDGEYRIRLPYYSYFPVLTSSNSSDWFTVHASEYIIAKATAEGFLLNWDEQRYGIWLQKAQVEYNIIVGDDKKKSLMQVQTLVPHTSGVYEQGTDI